MPSLEVALAPYVYLYGKTQEALEFYKNVFGGSYEIIMRGQDGSISHSELKASSFTLMLSDGGSKRDVDPDAGNVCLQLRIGDAAEAKTVFDALSNGGAEKVPFEAQPWGRSLGVVNDRFGTQWIITA
jgi:PhnB protein